MLGLAYIYIYIHMLYHDNIQFIEDSHLQRMIHKEYIHACEWSVDWPYLCNQTIETNNNNKQRIQKQSKHENNFAINDPKLNQALVHPHMLKIRITLYCMMINLSVTFHHPITTPFFSSWFPNIVCKLLKIKK